MNDLYTVLGVDRTATPAQIKSAYRKLAKTAHPDKGGDRTVWDQVSHAYEVLSDALRRAKYDATGDDTQTPDPEAAERAQVASIVREIISGVLRTSLDDPELVDFRSRILNDLNVKRQSMAQDRQNLVGKINRVERFIGRFVKDADGDDLIEEIVRQTLRELKAQIATVDNAILLHQKVVQVFLEYRYETDPMRNEGQWSPTESAHQRITTYLIGGSRSPIR